MTPLEQLNEAECISLTPEMVTLLAEKLFMPMIGVVLGTIIFAHLINYHLLDPLLAFIRHRAYKKDLVEINKELE